MSSKQQDEARGVGGETRGQSGGEGLVVPRGAVSLLLSAVSEGGLKADPAAERLWKSVGVCLDVPSSLRKATVKRLGVVDRVCERFLRRNPGGLVVSVGSLLGTRGQRVGRGRWLDVDPPAIAQMRREELGARPGYRQVALDLEEPDAWLRRLGRRAGPLLVVLEEPLLSMPERALGAWLDGVASHLPAGTELVVPADRRWALGIAAHGGQGGEGALVHCGQTITYWPGLRRSPLEGEGDLREELDEVRRLSILLRAQWVPSLLVLRLR